MEQLFLRNKIFVSAVLKLMRTLTKQKEEKETHFIIQISKQKGTGTD
jgi:hypothetical protein